MITFVIGGMTGVLLAVPPADFVLHNSLFLVAHFHNVIIGGVVFGMLAGITYWFPKAFGFQLEPFWGKCSFWFWLVGFYFAFMPLYVLGLMGVTRRLNHFDDPSLQIWFEIAAFGAVLILLGIVSFLVQIVVSFAESRSRCATRRAIRGTAARSNGRPPRRRRSYNFAFTPVVHDNDAWADMKKNGYRPPGRASLPIHMPKNTRPCRARRAERRFRIRADLAHVVARRSRALPRCWPSVIVHTFNYKRDFTPRGRCGRHGERADASARRGVMISLTRIRASCTATQDDHHAQDRDGSPVFYLVTSMSMPRAKHPARLLDLPDERLSASLRCCSRYRRARRQLCGRSVAQGPLRSAAGGGQHVDAAALVNHLRLRHAGDAGNRGRRRSGSPSRPLFGLPSSASNSASSRI